MIDDELEKGFVDLVVFAKMQVRHDVFDDGLDGGVAYLLEGRPVPGDYLAVLGVSCSCSLLGLAGILGLGSGLSGSCCICHFVQLRDISKLKQVEK